MTNYSATLTESEQVGAKRRHYHLAESAMGQLQQLREYQALKLARDVEAKHEREQIYIEEHNLHEFSEFTL